MIQPVFAGTDIEQLIWQQELTYIGAYRDADHEVIKGLWHKDFLGWPSSERAPIRKPQAPTFLSQRYPKPGLWQFKIEPQSIQSTGDIVITHYLLKTWPVNPQTGKAERQRTKIGKIVHTWLKQDGN